MILHLRAAVDQLYAAQPAGFTTLRTELVKQAREARDMKLATSVGRLRKPTAAAWALNHFVRRRPEGLDALRSFAALLREAQRSLDADQLRVLGRERASRVDDLAEAIAVCAREAGHPVGASVLQEVRDTLVTVIADEAAEASVLSGSLVRALSYSGFGEVDLDDVVAMRRFEGDPQPHAGAQGDRPDLEVLQGGAGAVDLDERRAARRASLKATVRADDRARLLGELNATRSALRAADRHVAVQTARHEEVTEGIADLERRLVTARDRLGKVARDLLEATSLRDGAEQAERETQRSLDTVDGVNEPS